VSIFRQNNGRQNNFYNQPKIESVIIAASLPGVRRASFDFVSGLPFIILPSIILPFFHALPAFAGKDVLQRAGLRSTFRARFCRTRFLKGARVYCSSSTSIL
jgi:hypothetical protein